MRNYQTEFLSNILENRKNFIELIIAAILFCFGVNLISSGVFGHYNPAHKNLIFTIAGILICLIGLSYFLFKFFGKKTFSRKIDGFFILDKKNKTVILVDNYKYSEELCDNLNYAFSEDKALKRIWHNVDYTQRGNDFKESLKIINEASEYYILEKLSTHLTTFFNDTRYDKNEIVEYQRNDIPDILLNNRFLELFSKPMNQRLAFIPDKPEKSSEKSKSAGKVIASYSNGAMYQHFDLELPKNSQLKRNSDSSISIVTERFTLNIKTIVSGVNTYIPWEFCKMYLGLDDFRNYSEFVVSFEIEINFHFGSLFRTLGWQYYDWIDSFIVEIEKDVDQNYFFDKKIEWVKVHAILKPLLNKNMIEVKN